MRLDVYSGKLSKDKEYWLVGDVGGTNSNIGLATVEARDDNAEVEVVMEAVESSSEITDFSKTVQDAMTLFQEKAGKVKLAGSCISGAGPVKDRVCRMTNQSWDIDGNILAQTLGTPVRIINDFTAVCYGLPLLDLNHSRDVLPLSRSDGKLAFPTHGMKAAIGAGTGLGVGFITPLGTDLWTAYPSEGGHMDFADFDEETREYKAYIMKTIDLVPEYEMVISGNGIKNLFYFYIETNRLSKEDPAAQEIFGKLDIEKPAVISQLSRGHPVLSQLMKTFVRMYARFAASVSSLLIPEGGLFLAGGIASKNQEFFFGDNLFMETFAQHCNPNIYKLLEHIPVYITLDYGISLKGAAYAAYCLRESD